MWSELTVVIDRIEAFRVVVVARVAGCGEELQEVDALDVAVRITQATEQSFSMFVVPWIENIFLQKCF